jgi:hypothetical protein
MISFRKYVEEVSAQAAQHGEELVQRMKSWRPTVEKPYPSAKVLSMDTGDSADALDVAAVLAGTKPAASFGYDFAISPLGVWMLRRAGSQGLIYSAGFGFTKDKEFVVGRPENVHNILYAYRELRKFAGSQDKKDMQREVHFHIVIGQNLGFPREAIHAFVGRHVATREPANV